MSQQFSLKANHRDTFRLVPVGSTDPGDYIHSPTDPTGFAYFEAAPANYYVYCRPAYTGEFVLINSQVGSGYQYLRTVNPEIDADGIISLASLVNNLTVYVESEENNLPYVTTGEVLSIRVLSTAGGVPSTGLQNAPDVTLYQKPGGTGQSVAYAVATYESNLYDTANPHIYHYTYTFNPNDPAGPPQDFYYFRANAAYEGIESPDHPDAQTFQLDFVAPTLTSTNVLLSSSSSNLADNMNNTSTASCFVSIPEASVSDEFSGPHKIHLQPFIKSQETDDAGGDGGFKYKGYLNNTHVFEDQHLFDNAPSAQNNWDLSDAGEWNVVIGPDDNGNSYLYRNYGNTYGQINHFTIQNLGNTPPDYVEIHIDDLTDAGDATNGNSVAPSFTTNAFYQYMIFRYKNYGYCDGDLTKLVVGDCETAGHTWKTAQDAVKEWPIEFAHGGNIVQNVLLTQSVPPGFVDDMEGVEYGFLISATDKATNTNISYNDFLKPSIVYDTIVEIAPNLSWWFVKNQTDSESTAYVNEYGWFNTGQGLNDGVCSDANETTQQGCCENGGTAGTWNPVTEVCSGSPSNIWTHDNLTLILQTVDNNQQQNTQFGVQVSYDGVNWTEYSQTGTNNLVNGTTSQYWVNQEIKQGSQILYVRSVHADGNVTGNTYAIEYKWDKEHPTWSSAGNVTGTGGFNRAFFTWDQSPADYGTDASHYADQGGRLEGSISDPGEGFSLAHKIRIYRSKNSGTTPSDWDVISAAPTTYDLVEIGLFPASIKNYTDTSFYNIDYSDQYLDPYFYWGVPIDMAGNEGQGRQVADGILLCPPAGIPVTPLQPADVAGALGTETTVDPNNNDTILTHRDIAVPTDGVIVRTNELARQEGIKTLSTSPDGFTYTTIPLVQRLGESYVPMFVNLTVHGVTTLNNGVQFPINGQSPSDLGLDHLVGYSNPNNSGNLGIVHLRRQRCKIGNSYSTGVVSKHACDVYGGTWESVTNAVVLDSITEDATPTTYLNLVSLPASIADELTGANGGAGELTDTTYTIHLGMLLEDNTTYALGIDPVDNQYYYRTQLSAAIYEGFYCTDHINPGQGSADIHSCLCGASGVWDGTSCTAGSLTGYRWLNDINLDTDGINWSTKLAADLIVGGTLRLETGLSIWSGGYVDGEPTGTGLSMDQVGLTMFNGAQETIRLNSNDGSFAMGDLSDPAGNKIQFDPVSGQVSLIGNLYQITPEAANYTPEYAGEWIPGTCSDQQYTTEEECCIGDSGSWNGSSCSGGNGVVTWTVKLYTSGDTVLYNADYWICIANQTAVGAPSLTDTVHWVLYASSGMEGQAATNLSISAESSTFTATEDGIVTSPNDIRIVANASNIAGDLTWSIDAINLADTDISGNINLYTDESCSVVAGSVLSDSTPVYLCASNLNSQQAKAVTITATYTLTTDDGNTDLLVLSDSQTFTRLTEGASAYNIILSNETHSVVGDEYGNVTQDEWTNAFTTVQLYRGTEARDCTIATSITPSGEGWTATPFQTTLPNHPTVYITNNPVGDVQDEALTGYATIAVTDTESGDVVGNTIFTVSKQLAGVSSKTVSLSSSSNTWTIDPNSREIVGNTSVYFNLSYPNIDILNLSWTLSASPTLSFNGNISAYAPGTAPVEPWAGFQVIANQDGGSHSTQLFLNTGDVGTEYSSFTVQVQVTEANTNEIFTDIVTIQRLELGSDAYVGSLSNDSYSIAADYNGNIESLADAGGEFTVYRGTTLLEDMQREFRTIGAWYGRLWKDPDMGGDVFGNLTLEYLRAFESSPTYTKTVKWEDLNAFSEIKSRNGNPINFWDNPSNEDWDQFVAWVTTWIEVGSDFSISSAVFAGDNEHRLYINNVVPPNSSGGLVEDQSHANTDTYDYEFTTTGGYTAPDNSNVAGGRWYKIDMLYYDNTGGDNVTLGWNPSNVPEIGLGGGAVVGDIDPNTGLYSIIAFNEPHANTAKLFLAADIDDDLDAVFESSIEKQYTISKSQSGDPGSYYRYLYHTSNQYLSLTALMNDMQNNADLDYPSDHPDQDSLQGWIDTYPPAPVPGFSTWETRKLYRTDNTSIEGEGWSIPGVSGSVPLDPVIYFIRPTNGTSLMNGENSGGGSTLEVVAMQQDQTNGESVVPEGTIKLSATANGSEGDGSNTRSFTSNDIDGSLTIYMVDTSNNAVLDTITLVDVSDGIPVGVITADPGLVFTQSSGGSWSPQAIVITVTFYDSEGNVANSGTATFEETDGLITNTVAFQGNGITEDITGLNSNQVGLRFTQDSTGMQAMETIYSVSRGQQGQTGDTGAAGPAVTYTGGWDYNRSQYTAGIYSGENADGEQSDSPVGDVVRYDHLYDDAGSDFHALNGEYFICIQTHTPSGGTPPKDPAGNVHPFWQPFGAQFQSVATDLLLADTILAEEIFGANVTLTDTFKIKTPGGTCEGISIELYNFDQSGGLADSDDTDQGYNYRGHFQLGHGVPDSIDPNNTSRVRVHNVWDYTGADGNGGTWDNTESISSFYSTFEEFTVKVIALTRYEDDTTDQLLNIESIQPGEYLYITAVGANRIADHGEAPYIYKVVEDPLKKDAGLPTGVYRARQLHDALIAAGMPTPGAPPALDVFQIDVELVEIDNREVLCNTNTTVINDGANEGAFALGIHVGAADQGDCEGLGGTWYPSYAGVDLSVAGMSFTNSQNEETIKLNANDGGFVFGVEGSSDYIEYDPTIGNLSIHGQVFIDGGQLEDPARNINLNTDTPMFAWETCVVSWQGELDLDPSSIAHGAVYDSALWQFTLDQPRPVLVRLKIRSANSTTKLRLNNLAFPLIPDNNQHDTALQDNWYEFYDEDGNANAGLNMITLNRAAMGVASTLLEVQVFSYPTTDEVVVELDSSNLGDNPIITWSASEVLPGEIGNGNLQVPLTNITDTSAALTLYNFQNLEQGSAGSLDDLDLDITSSGYTVVENNNVWSTPDAPTSWGGGGAVQSPVELGELRTYFKLSRNEDTNTGNNRVMAGLSNDTTDNSSYSTIDYAIYRTRGSQNYANNCDSGYCFNDQIKLYHGPTQDNYILHAEESEFNTNEVLKMDDWIFRITLIPDTSIEFAVDKRDGYGFQMANIDHNNSVFPIPDSNGYRFDTSCHGEAAISDIQFGEFPLSDQNSKPVLSSAVRVTATAKATDNGWTQDVFDSITFVRGLSGVAGSSSITAILSNESITTDAETSGSWAGPVSTDITVFSGTNDVTDQATFVISDNDSWATHTISDNTMSISAIPDGYSSGFMTVDISYGGVTISKTFTVSLARAGYQGIDGNPGAAQFLYDNLDTSGDALGGNDPDQGCYQIIDMDGADWSTNPPDGMRSGFESATGILLNKLDTNGEDRSAFYNLLTAGADFIFYVSANRYYHFVLSEDPEEVSDDRFGFHLQYISHVVDNDTQIGTGPGTFLYMQFGVVQPGVRGSRNYTDDVCGDIDTWTSGDGNSFTAGETWFESIATGIASEDGGPMKRDQMTQYCEEHGHSITKFWDGGAWADVAQVIDGNLLVDGTIHADALDADSVTAEKIEAGAITADKLSVGAATGNLLGTKVPHFSSWGEMQLGTGTEVGAWSFTLMQGSGSAATGTTSKRDIAQADTHTHNTLKVQMVGGSWGYVYTPWVIVDPGASYDVGALIGWENASIDGNSTSFFVGVETSNCSNPNVSLAGCSADLNMAEQRKVTTTSGETWGNAIWTSPALSGANKGFYFTKMDGNTDVAARGMANGLSSSYDYDDYWVPAMWTVHKAASNLDVMKNGAAREAFRWLSGADGDGRIGGQGYVSSLRMSSGSQWMRLRFQVLQHDTSHANSGDNGTNTMCIAHPFIRPGNSTQIDGGSITTNSIHADSIQTDTLVVDVELTANEIEAGSIVSSNEQTFWSLDNNVYIVKDNSGQVRVKIGDLDASESITDGS